MYLFCCKQCGRLEDACAEPYVRLMQFLCRDCLPEYFKWRLDQPHGDREVLFEFVMAIDEANPGAAMMILEKAEELKQADYKRKTKRRPWRRRPR